MKRIREELYRILIPYVDRENERKEIIEEIMKAVIETIPYHFWGCNCPDGLVGERCGTIRKEAIAEFKEKSGIN